MKGEVMDTEKYLGWTNYVTWAVALWLGNDPDTDARTRKIVKQYREKEKGNAEEMLRYYVEELIGEAAESGLSSDLLAWALDQVNWTEIVTHYLDGGSGQ
jgi:hypothetical protein